MVWNLVTSEKFGRAAGHFECVIMDGFEENMWSIYARGTSLCRKTQPPLPCVSVCVLPHSEVTVWEKEQKKQPEYLSFGNHSELKSSDVIILLQL